MRSFILILVSFFSLNALADLIYLYPLREGSFRLVSFALKQETLEVLISSTLSAQDAQTVIDETNIKLGELQALATNGLEREAYESQYARRFPMVVSFSVPAKNFSGRMAEVLDEQLFPFDRPEQLELAFERINFEDKLSEILMASSLYDREGFHEKDYMEDLERYLRKKSRLYARSLSEQLSKQYMPPELDLKQANQMLEQQNALGKPTTLHVLSDADLLLLASAYDIAFMKTTYQDSLYRAIEEPYPYLHEDLVASLEERFNVTLKLKSAWTERVREIVRTEARIPIWAIDREMNVMRHLR